MMSIRCFARNLKTGDIWMSTQIDCDNIIPVIILSSMKASNYDDSFYRIEYVGMHGIEITYERHSNIFNIYRLE